MLGSLDFFQWEVTGRKLYIYNIYFSKLLLSKMTYSEALGQETDMKKLSLKLSIWVLVL